MKIAIIGSREGFTEGMVLPHLNYFYDCNNPSKNTFISGGAKGVDSMVAEYAKELGIPMEIIRPRNPSNKMDYLYRNIEIITKADLILAFWDGKSRGTKFVIDYADARKKPISVIDLSEVKKRVQGFEQGKCKCGKVYLYCGRDIGYCCDCMDGMEDGSS